MTSGMSNFALRCDALRQLLAKQSLAALLVTDERNVTYLTGFTGEGSVRSVTTSDGEIPCDLAVVCTKKVANTARLGRRHNPG